MTTIRVHKIDGKPVDQYMRPRTSWTDTLVASIIRIAVASGIGCVGILFYGIITIAR